MSLNENQSADVLPVVSRDEWAAQIGTKFRFFQSPGWIEAELIEVSPLKKLPKLENFSLLFQMPADFAVVQENFSFEHETLGAAEIFIVPIEKNVAGTIFQAVFNRLSLTGD